LCSSWATAVSSRVAGPPMQWVFDTGGCAAWTECARDDEKDGTARTGPVGEDHDYGGDPTVVA